MNMMIRLSLAAATAAGGLLLTSCDPYGPPPGYPRSPYDAPGPRAPGPRQPTRGDGYGDPYGNNDGGYGDSSSFYGNRGDSGDGRDGGGSRGGDTYGSNDGGGYTENPPPSSNPPPNNSGGGSGSGTKKSYPTATKTANPDRVLSPYPPYNVIDVAGIKSGKLAKDPSTGEVFRVP